VGYLQGEQGGGEGGTVLAQGGQTSGPHSGLVNGGRPEYHLHLHLHLNSSLHLFTFIEYQSELNVNSSLHLSWGETSHGGDILIKTRPESWCCPTCYL
jgi:hypothetical protein